MRFSIRLGRVFGVPLGLNYTWFFIFALITFTLAEQFLAASQHNPRTFVPLNDAVRWALAVGTSLLFFASLLAHELAHSVVALAKGIPVRGITLFIFGGVSQIAREAERPGTELAVAIVGPVSSALLGLVFWGFHVALDPLNPYLGLGAWRLAQINFVLAVFNMVPGFPLDGGRVLRAAIWGATNNYSRATLVATRVGQATAWAMIMAGIVMAMIADLLQGIWLVLIGWFLSTAASGARNQFRLRQYLEGLKAKDLVARSCPSVPESLTLDVLVDGYIMPTGCRLFLVTQFSEPRGIVTTRQVRAVPRPHRREVRVGSIMLPLQRFPAVGPEEDAYRVLELMAEAGVAELPVVEKGAVVGLISREDVLRVASTRSEVGR